MKSLILSLAVLSAVASHAVQAEDSGRYRREPQGSVVLQGTQPLSGPNRHPSIDLNYNQKLINNDRTRLDAYGGANWQGGRHVTPHAGVNYEHQFRNNMFLSGQGQVQPGPRGGISPSVNAGLGWRFRREALPYEEEELQDEFEEETY